MMWPRCAPVVVSELRASSVWTLQSKELQSRHHADGQWRDAVTTPLLSLIDRNLLWQPNDFWGNSKTFSGGEWME